ncbi:MAG: hypothetical protein FWB98_07490 [Defluviitaleaceae bacterium]|nr:hypothetical protein [Defluviitaleaceae bacterium]
MKDKLAALRSCRSAMQGVSARLYGNVSAPTLEKMLDTMLECKRNLESLGYNVSSIGDDEEITKVIGCLGYLIMDIKFGSASGWTPHQVNSILQDALIAIDKEIYHLLPEKEKAKLESEQRAAKEREYEKLLEKEKTATTESDFRDLASGYKELGDFKDAKERANLFKMKVDNLENDQMKSERDKVASMGTTSLLLGIVSSILSSIAIHGASQWWSPWWGYNITPSAFVAGAIGLGLAIVGIVVGNKVDYKSRLGKAGKVVSIIAAIFASLTFLGISCHGACVGPGW